MNKNTLLPWSQLMAFGLGRLRLTPNDFWAMTLREMDAAVEGYTGSSKIVSIPSRVAVNHLMTRYPDNEMENTS